jgi:hypothetical protein
MTRTEKPLDIRRRALKWVSLASILVLAALAPGCGSSSQSTTAAAPTVRPPNIKSLHDLLVTAKDVKAAGPGSPSGVLLGWWRALQLHDVGAASSAYARSVNVNWGGQQPSLLGELNGLSYALQRSRPKVVDVVHNGGKVHLSVVIANGVFQDPTTVTFIRQTPASFELTKEGGEWKLANNDYLRQTLEAQVASTK